jgi:hypothetical protein
VAEDTSEDGVVNQGVAQVDEAGHSAKATHGQRAHEELPVDGWPSPMGGLLRPGRQVSEEALVVTTSGQRGVWHQGKLRHGLSSRRDVFVKPPDFGEPATGRQEGKLGRASTVIAER